jgi:sulfate adenylyltransferase subunit 1 (EFTu-like GTPase family)
MMPEISSIYLNAREYPDANWRIMQVHSVGPLSRDDLETVVRQKEAKAADYEACDAHWLLIVVDGINAAQEQEIRIDGFSLASSRFERIIVFHTFGYILDIGNTTTGRAV